MAAIDIPICSMCHRETNHMHLTLLKGQSKTEICSTRCFILFRALESSCKRFKAQAQKQADIPALMLPPPAMNRKMAPCPSKINLEIKK